MPTITPTVSPDAPAASNTRRTAADVKADRRSPKGPGLDTGEEQRTLTKAGTTPTTDTDHRHNADDRTSAPLPDGAGMWRCVIPPTLTRVFPQRSTGDRSRSPVVRPAITSAAPATVLAAGQCGIVEEIVVREGGRFQAGRPEHARRWSGVSGFRARRLEQATAHGLCRSGGVKPCREPRAVAPR